MKETKMELITQRAARTWILTVADMLLHNNLTRNDWLEIAEDLTSVVKFAQLVARALEEKESK
jgi:hypothetical protein